MVEINKSRHKARCSECGEQRGIHPMPDGRILCYKCLDEYITGWKK